MKRRFGVVLFALLITAGIAGCGGEHPPDNERLLTIFSEGRTGVWVSGHGSVIRALSADDSSQRFLVRVDDELDLVVRHRIGSAGPVPVERGVTIAFSGRYEFHGGGGEVLLTHADPAQPGGGGWIDYQGTRYD